MDTRDTGQPLPRRTPQQPQLPPETAGGPPAAAPAAKPARARKPGEPPKGVKIAIVVFIVGLVAWIALTNDDSSHTKAVTRGDYPATWPLTVDAGTLECIDGGKVTIKIGSIRYALNGTARTDNTLEPVDPIWADDPHTPGLKLSIGPLIADGLKLC